MVLRRCFSGSSGLGARTALTLGAAFLVEVPLDLLLRVLAGAFLTFVIVFFVILVVVATFLAVEDFLAGGARLTGVGRATVRIILAIGKYLLLISKI